MARSPRLVSNAPVSLTEVRAVPQEKSPGPSVKDDEFYESLREDGNSKEKAARIANASSSAMVV